MFLFFFSLFRFSGYAFLVQDVQNVGKYSFSKVYRLIAVENRRERKKNI